jgi:hypothetical protein
MGRLVHLFKTDSADQQYQVSVNIYVEIPALLLAVLWSRSREPKLNCQLEPGAKITNFGSSSGSFLFITGLKKFY